MANHQHTPRFSPGTSGNPRGRPKGSKNIDHELDQLLTSIDSARCKGERRRNALQGLLRRWIKRAIAGERKAVVKVFELMVRYDNTPEPEDRGRRPI